MLQKPCMGNLFPQAGLEHQVQVSELLLVVYPSAAEAKNCPIVALAASMKNTLYAGILLSPAFGDAE